jgi:bifunctional enzyme CysN/CysC
MSSCTASRLNLVVVGHVDHGKSTLLGRLLADTGSLPEGKLKQIRELCDRTAKPFEYAFLLDALKDERAQGITIESARVFFKTAARHYVVIDAPGHIEFVKNMVTGAAQAEAALLVIDAHEGLQENSSQHATLLSMLGIRQLAVVVNKMDLVAYRQEAFEAVVAAFSTFLSRLGITAGSWIPVAAREGANVVAPAIEMPWFTGPTLLEVLEAFECAGPAVGGPFRMPVQDVYKFTNFNDDRRIIAGTVESGRVRVGDELVFYPSGRRARAVTFETFNEPRRTQATAGETVGFIASPQVYVARGELAGRADECAPQVTSRIRARLFWLGCEPLTTQRDCVFKLGTVRVLARVEMIHQVIDASDLRDLGELKEIARNQVAECTLKLHRAIAFDLSADLAATGRFVLVEDHDIRGGGIVIAALTDRDERTRNRVLVRDARWVSGHVSPEQRAARYGQRPTLVLITGEVSTDRKELARRLESQLFDEGRHVYFLAMGSVLYGVDADLGHGDEQRFEHFRRLGEVAHILLDAGLILIVSVAALTEDDLDTIKTALPVASIYTVWVGDRVTTNLRYDATLGDVERGERGALALKTLLEERDVIPKTC